MKYLLTFLLSLFLLMILTGFAHADIGKNLGNFTLENIIKKIALDDESSNLFAIGNYSGSIAVSDEALIIDPNDTTALVTKGIDLIMLGNYTASIDFLNKALEIDPNDTTALTDKAFVLIIMGKNNEGRIWADRAILIDSNHVKAWYVKMEALSFLGKTEESSEAYKKMISINSTDFGDLEFIANQLYNYQRYKDEIPILDQMLKLQPNDTATLGTRGELEVKLGNYDEALGSFSQILSINPDDTETLDKEGNVLIKLGQYQNAIQVFEHSLQLNNEDPQALSGNGFALFNLGKYENAIQQYDKTFNYTYTNSDLLTLAEREADAMEKLNETEKLVQYGKQSYSYGDYDQALIYYDHFLQFEPKNVTILEEKAKTSDLLKRPSLTMLTADKILEIQPDDFLAFGLKGYSLYSEGKYDEAEKYYTEALDINPNDVFSLVGKGDVLASEGHYIKAIEAYQAVIQNNLQSDDPFVRNQILNAYLRLADAYVQLGQFKNADDQFNWMLRNSVNNTDVFDARGEYYFNQNKPEDAIIWYDKSLQVDGSDWVALSSKAACLFELRDYNDTITYLHLALDQNPDDPITLTNEAEALNKVGNFTWAIEATEKAIEFDPKNADALTKKGDAFLGLGSYWQAEKWYDKALDIEPDNEYALAGKGEALLMIGSYDQSIQYLDESLDKLSLNSKTKFGGLTTEEQDLRDEASKDKTVALIDIGNQELDQQPADALEKFEKALSIEPQNEAALKGKEDASKAVSNNIFWQNVNQFAIIIGVIASAAAIVPFIHLHKKRKQRIKNQKLKDNLS